MIDSIYHGSFDPNLTEIEEYGCCPFNLFGGLFAGDYADAESHGEHVYEIVSPHHLDDFTLNYELDAFGLAVEIAGDEDTAEAILDAECPVPDHVDPEGAAEYGWNLQRLRGELARRLGYTSVEMHDEHGSTVLCLPGCEIRNAKEHAEEVEAA